MAAKHNPPLSLSARTTPPIAISVKEAALRLMIDVSTYYRQVHPYVLSGEIASIKIGRARRIIVTSFDAWIARQTQYTASGYKPVARRQ